MSAVKGAISDTVDTDPRVAGSPPGYETYACPDNPIAGTLVPFIFMRGGEVEINLMRDSRSLGGNRDVIRGYISDISHSVEFTWIADS